MSEKDYEQAEAGFLALKEELDQEAEPSDKILELKADIEYALGKLYLNEGLYHKAFDLYSSAYAYYGSALGADAGKTVDARIQLAEMEEIYYGRREHALGEYLDIYETVDAPAYRNAALCDAASAYISLDNGPETERYIGLVQDLADEAARKDSGIAESFAEKDDKTEAFQSRVLGRLTEKDQYLYAFDLLGNYYIECEDPDEAIKMYQEALSFLDRAGTADEESRIGIYENLGFVYLYFKGQAEDNEYLRKAAELADRLYPRGSEKASLYISLAEMYLAAGDYEKFGSYLEEAVDMARESVGENHRLVALSKILLSDYYRKIGEYQKAIKSCQEAIEIRKNILEEDNDALGSDYNNLANCYIDGGLDDRAIEAYLKSIEIYNGSHNNLQVAVADRNIALIYNNTYHEHALALKYANEAISLVEPMDASYYGGTIAAIYMVMADILDRSDEEYQKIEEYSEKARIHLENAVGNTDEEMGNYHYNLGKYLSDNSRFPEAADHLLDALSLFETVYKEIKLYPVDIFYDIGYCFYYTGFYDKALDFFERSVEYTGLHIALMNEQGNYRTSYWQNSRERSSGYIREINSVQAETVRNYFGGRYLDGNDEIVFYNESPDGTVELSIAWYRLFVTDPMTCKREGNTIFFDYYGYGQSAVSGSIVLGEEEAVLTVDHSTAPYVEEGVKHFTFYSNEDLAEETKQNLMDNTDMTGWLRSNPPPWQPRAYLHFDDGGKLQIWTETEDGRYSKEEVQYTVTSQYRILIGEEEFSIEIYNRMLYITSIHSDERQIHGAYELMLEDDGIYSTLK